MNSFNIVPGRLFLAFSLTIGLLMGAGAFAQTPGGNSGISSPPPPAKTDEEKRERPAATSNCDAYSPKNGACPKGCQYDKKDDICVGKGS
jgi:hypothetical protein